MKVTGMTTGAAGSHKDRHGDKPRMTWGDCGKARTNTPAYEEGIERIFGSKRKKREYTPDELAFLERKRKHREANPRPVYPY